MARSVSALRVRSDRAGYPPAAMAHEDDEPDSPIDLGKRSWIAVLKRTWREFREDNLIDWAAALTYYGVLSLFPGLLVLVSLLSLVGASATQPLIDNLGQVAPGEAKEIATNALQGLQDNRSTGGVMALVGLGVALWSASN